jgi:hypothetical protein
MKCAWNVCGPEGKVMRNNHTYLPQCPSTYRERQLGVGGHITQLDQHGALDLDSVLRSGEGRGRYPPRM